MSCEICMKLLELYQCSLDVCRESVDKLSGTIGDDFNYALKVARLALKASEDAADAITIHQISHHGLDPARARLHHVSKAAHSG